MFESRTIPTDVARVEAVKDLTTEVVDSLERMSCEVENVNLQVNWDVKKVNGQDELVPVVSLTFTT